MRKVGLCLAIILTWFNSFASTPIKDFLNEDGTLRAGVNGGFDAEGYSVSINEDGKPFFQPFGTGDERWSSVPPYVNLPGSIVYAVAQIGNDIYVGGAFTDIGGDATKRYIARWDGSTWRSVGGGVDGQVLALAVVGTNLYVGGDFAIAGGVSNTGLIAMWDGTQWYSVGALLWKQNLTIRVRTLFVSGSDVYVGGNFSGTLPAGFNNNVLKWHPDVSPGVGTWSTVGSQGSLPYYARSVFVQGTNVYATQEYNNGDGSGLHAYATVFNGTTWTQLGPEVNAALRAIAFYNSKVYIGGEFTDASGNPAADYIAVWNGTQWTDVGGGLNATVTTLNVIGSRLYVGGNFSGGPVTSTNAGVALWNGSSWEASGMTAAGVFGITGTESNMILVGSFQNVDNMSNATNIVKRVSGTIQQLNPGPPNSSYNVAMLNSELYVYGFSFSNPPPPFIRFKDGAWQTVDATLNGLVTIAKSSGSLLYAGGTFTNAGGIDAADYIATWNGSSWAAVAAAPVGSASVTALDIENGKVYACFKSSTNEPGIYVLNGSTWSRLGSTLTNFSNPTDIEVIGSTVYVSSSDTDINGDPKADRLIQWDGTAWKPVSNGLPDYVNSIDEIDGKLYVTGGFVNVDGVAINDYLVIWDGTSWSTIGNGLAAGATLPLPGNAASANIVVKSGNNLYVGLDYLEKLGGNPNIYGVGVWNGVAWENLGTGLDAGVFRLMIDDNVLYCGGGFKGTKDKSVAASYVIKRNGLLPSINFVSMPSITPTTASFNGTGLRGGMSTNYFIEYGTTSGNYSNTVPGQATSTGSNSDNITFDLSQLNPNTKYYYRLRATNDEGDSFVKETTFTTPALAAASTGVATEITAVGAKLDALVDPNGVSTTTYFQWGTTTSFGSKTADQVLTGDGAQPVFATLTGLSDNTVYYFRITATTSAGTVNGANGTFTTVKIDAATGSASEVSTNSAKIEANVNPNGASAQVYFEYGLSTDFGITTPEQTVSGSDDQRITANLTDLLEGNTYYYRVVAKTALKLTPGDAKSFNTITTAKKLSFGASAITHTVDGNDHKVSATMSDGSGVKVGKVFYRGIRGTDYSFVDATSTGQKMEASISGSELDEVGLDFYFTASDATTGSDPVVSPTSYIYTTVSQSIPNLSSGGQPENYRIISIPASVSNSDPRTVFNSAMIQFGGYNIDNWRLMRYQPGEPQGQNIDFESITQIEAGKGYWFNSVDKVDIPVTGTTVEANQKAPFKLQLQKGWNQVGNPYTFDINWSDVVAANDNPAALGNKFYVYDPSNQGFKEAAAISAWSGGFIKATDAMTINIPVKFDGGAGRGYDPYSISNSDISEPSWFIPITIQQGETYNDLPGIGMDPNASNGNDRFDEQTLPRFINYLELNTIHHEFFMPKFARDVVRTSAGYQWDFTINSSYDDPDATLRWDAASMGDNNSKLILYDQSAGELVDMKTTNTYSFKMKGSHSVTIFYSVDEKHFDSNISGAGKPYPNPFRDRVTVPFFIGGSADVQLSVYDLTGRKIRTIINGKFEHGLYEATWNGESDNGERLSAGVYIYRFSSMGSKTVTGRIVLN